MRQRLRAHLTYANVVATLSLFLVLGGGTALASYVISSNAQVGPGTISGHKPPTGDHANIIGGSINGQDIADRSVKPLDLGEGAIPESLVYNRVATSSAAPELIRRVGPWAIKARCQLLTGFINTARLDLIVNGPAGTAQWSLVRSRNDDTGKQYPESGGKFLSAQTNEEILHVWSGSDQYERQAGTVLLQAGARIQQVEFNALSDNREGSRTTCGLYGMANLGS